LFAAIPVAARTVDNRPYRGHRCAGIEGIGGKALKDVYMDLSVRRGKMARKRAFWRGFERQMEKEEKIYLKFLKKTKLNHLQRRKNPI